MANPPAPVDHLRPIRDAATKLAEKIDADVLLYNGAIKRPYDSLIIETCTRRRRRKNVFLMLTTSGGDAHPGYRIARVLQQNYERFLVFVPGYCKSAGVLLLLGAHELVLSRHAELGPLDAQVLRTDEVGARSSALAPGVALDVLQSRSQSAFVTMFRKLREMQMTTSLAAEVSANWAASLFSDIMGQVDPMKLGEVERANQIALDYGRRLIAVGKNATDDALVQLVAAYPSHGFVIDHEEAKALFKNVRQADATEIALGIRDPISEDDAFWTYLNDERPEASDGTADKPDGKAANDSGGSGEADGAPAGGTAAQADAAADGGRQGTDTAVS